MSPSNGGFHCAAGNSRPSSIGALTAFRIMRFCCVRQPDSHKWLCPSRWKCRTVGQVLRVAPRVRSEGWWPCLPDPSRKWGLGGRGGSQTVAAALRIDWIHGSIEAEQQKWVSLQAPAQPGPDRPARGRLAGCH